VVAEEAWVVLSAGRRAKKSGQIIWRDLAQKGVGRFTCAPQYCQSWPQLTIHPQVQYGLCPGPTLGIFRPSTNTQFACKLIDPAGLLLEMGSNPQAGDMKKLNRCLDPLRRLEAEPPAEVLILARLFSRALKGTLLVLACASLRADTVRSQFPNWTPTCDGYTTRGDCIPGERRWVGANDEVHTRYLARTPEVAVVPEPGYFVAVGLGLAGLWWWKRK
jgi:hypothetical protein